LISDRSVLTTANTATLSVILTFTSVPSRVLIPSMLPSTLSMVPRMRTVGACCAKADEARMETAAKEATSRRGIQMVGFGIGVSLRYLVH